MEESPPDGKRPASAPRPEVYVSIDVEADGPIPGSYSMLSLGAVAVAAAGAPLGEFAVNLHRLESAGQHPATMAFWAKIPEAYAKTREGPVEPRVAMARFATWLGKLPGRPVAVAYPATYDFMWVRWYMQHLLGGQSGPLGRACIDLKTLAWAALGDGAYRDVVKRHMPREWFAPGHRHTHEALADAREQAALFLAVRKALGDRRGP